MQVLCDFDGTITRQDSTDFVLNALADPQWRVLQDEWEAGRLSGRACMQGQIALIRGSLAELDATLDGVELDPSFTRFVDWCEARGFPLTIASDGVDYFITRLLGRDGLERLPRVANRLEGAPGAWSLTCPERPADCESGSGVCKCATTVGASADDTLIVVGDGRSDFCVGLKADILFAKGALAEYADRVSKPYLPFDTFDDVTRSLSVLVGEGPVLRHHTISA
ncbi:MtnX-like HAD-IB family phosphatase [Phenylobacterium sp.]|uniref:MtnX-like HAD-IB family phosphatase n=1 Tax=Phenylobacterium sp. TaxID=1871053 RepID=UPI003565E4FB